MTNLKSLFLAVMAVCLSTPGLACTSFIVSGRVTPDGRPLAFKNRDTPDLNNHVVFVAGERYRFVGVTPDDDAGATNIFQGHNEKGFFIFDTAAYNLNSGDTTDTAHKPKSWFRHHGEGWLMRRALEVCATAQDFEALLDTLRRPWGCDGNIGVIDAAGNAAYYEVGNRSYVKFDVNDPQVAPNGYLIRTNHGFSGDRTKDQGVERYLAISQIMLDAAYSGRLNAQWLFSHVVRSLRHGLTGIDLLDLQPADASRQKLFPFRDFIPRYLTASATLFVGVKPGEDALHTVGYTIIGNTLTTVAVPIVITPEGRLPQIVAADKDGHSPLCQAGLRLKHRLFPYDCGNGHDYIDIAQLVNRAGTGIMQRVVAVEDTVLQHARPVMDAVRSANPDYSKVYDYYRWVDEYVGKKVLIL